jgi:hypothetical protein
VAAQIALRIDALNGETGQILHSFPPSGAAQRQNQPAHVLPTEKNKRWRELWRSLPVVSRENTTICGGTIAKPEEDFSTQRSLSRHPFPKIVSLQLSCSTLGAVQKVVGF